MRVLILPLLALTTLQVRAHVPADGVIHAMLGAMTYASHPRHHSFKNSVLIDPSLLVEADVSKHGGLEIGFFYLRNAFSVRDSGKVYTESIKRIYISTGYRHWFNPAWSVALGFASSYTIGDPHPQQNEFGGYHPLTSASDTTEYGVDLSVQHEPYRSGRLSVVIDLRYGWSLTPKRNEDSNHVGALVGVKYFVQSRERAPED